MPSAFIDTPAGHRIESSETLRVLGFYFDSSPSVHANMKIVQRKFKSRVWCLRHLKKNGFSTSELVKVYKTMIRPVAEYCSSVYHALITGVDTLEMERIQMQALKAIFGWRNSYSKLLELSGVDRLQDRREEAFIKLARKMNENPRFAHCFPRRLYRDGVQIRRTEKYKIYKASTGRCLNSPLNLMRRKLNELDELGLLNAE